MKAFASELEDFNDLIRAVAGDRNLPPAIVEKDYYVVRALRALEENIRGQFVFKGGTSLSKGWNLLERFSEDIDLLFRVEEDGVAVSKNQLNRRMKNAQTIVEQTEGFTLAHSFSDQGVHRTSKFSYRRSFDPVSALGDTVMLEMGTRGGVNPSTLRRIQSYIAEYAQEHGLADLAGDLAAFDVQCLDVRRTFVEKLYAVHAAYEKNRAEGKARHYYDLHQLAGMEEVRAFAGTEEYREVCRDSEKYSRENWPDASLPEGGSFAQSPAFTPDAEGRAALERNYEREVDLFFVPPPTMEAILARMQELLPRL